MEHEPQPEHYIIVEEKDGTFSAFIRYANFESKTEALIPNIVIDL